jgi:hypothetical protein
MQVPGGDDLTTGTKLHQALGMMKTLSGEFQTFVLDTDNADAKQMYSRFSKQLDQMVNEFSSRVSEVESQEPTYRLDRMVQQASQQQQAAQQQQTQQTQQMRQE